HADGHALRHRRPGRWTDGSGDGQQPHSGDPDDPRLPDLPAVLPRGHRLERREGIGVYCPRQKGRKDANNARDQRRSFMILRRRRRARIAIVALAALGLFTAPAAAQTTITFWPSSNPEEIAFATQIVDSWNA